MLRVLVSATAVLLLLHGLGAHTPLGAALPVPADAAPEVTPVDGPVPGSDSDGCPEQGEQTGESGCVRPSQPCRDHGRRACGRETAGTAAPAVGAAARVRAATRSTGSPGGRTGPLLPVFRC